MWACIVREWLDFNFEPLKSGRSVFFPLLCSFFLLLIVLKPILPSQSELIQWRELRKPIMVIFELTWHDYVGEHFHYKHPTWHHYRRMCKRFFWSFVVDFIVSTTRKSEEDNERGCCDYNFDTNIQQDISDVQVFNWSLSRFCELIALVWRNMLRLSSK